MAEVKRIGLSQRAHAVQGYGERRDMLDQRWAALIERLGACPLPLASNVSDIDRYLAVVGLDGLILTGGNDIATLEGAGDSAPERDRFEAAAYRYCVSRGKPVLGICRGAQMINHLEGGRLVRIDGHAGSRHSLRWAAAVPPHWHRPAEVNSYHGWAIPADGLAAGMVPLAWADDGSVEAFHAAAGPISAIVWHPEREADPGPDCLAFMAAALGLPNSQ